MAIQNLSIVWNRVVVEIIYNDDWLNLSRKIHGGAMAHLEISSQNKQRLPMTETGYRSHFISTSEIEDYGGAEKFVRDWLDEQAQSRAWKSYVKQSNQLALF